MHCISVSLTYIPCAKMVDHSVFFRKGLCTPLLLLQVLCKSDNYLNIQLSTAEMFPPNLAVVGSLHNLREQINCCEE